MHKPENNPRKAAERKTMAQIQAESELIEQVKQGNQQALERLIEQVQDQVYNLALRMLQVPGDAEDATQEILLRVVTHLSEFRQESTFTTWVYRIATNYLLTTSKRRAERQNLTFQYLGDMLDSSLARGEASIPVGYDQHLLAREVQYHCTLGMLICLDRAHRIAYILGEIFEVSSEEGSYILELTPTAFRKRLSRARGQLRTFVQQKCGIVDSANPCRCAKQVGNEIQAGLLHPTKLRYVTAEQVIPAAEVYAGVQEMRELDKTAALFRTHPDYKAPEAFLNGIRQLLRSGRFGMFLDTTTECLLL
jgi:RNA polymerase sigma factor (sigma-70 family)